MKGTVRWMLLTVCALSAFMADGQTYNTLIPDKEYYDFINKDILRDSVKVKHHVFREYINLNPEEFYYKDSADYYSKNTYLNSHFIFRQLPYGNKVLTNGLDTIFTRGDIDFFGEQFRAMTKDTVWRYPFVNSIFIDSVEYDKKDKRVWGRRMKWGIWRYSLPLFSLDRRYAIIIKSNSVGGGYYIYKRIENGDWILVKVINQWAEC